MSKRSPEREEFLQGVLTTGVEGGTGYWAAVSGYHWSDEEPGTARVTLHELNDDETAYDGPQHEVTIDTIATGIRRILSGEVGVRSDLEQMIRVADRTNGEGDDHSDGSIDADGADVIFQAAIFGELVYG